MKNCKHKFCFFSRIKRFLFLILLPLTGIAFQSCVQAERPPYSVNSPLGLLFQLFSNPEYVYFVAADAGYGAELWRTDGTAQGTERLTDICLGTCYSYIDNITNLNGTIFFSAFNGSTYELYKWDGGSNAVQLTFTNVNPYTLTPVGRTLFFTGYDSTYGTELWKANGTESGTVRLTDMFGPAGYPVALADVNGTLFFTAYDGTSSTELYKWDGANATQLTTGSVNPYNLTSVGGTLYFVGYDPTNGMELWKSNGTATGTSMVKDINSLAAGYSSNPNYLINFNGTLYFSADDGNNGSELWKSDGTDTGTVGLTNICTLGCSSNPSYLTVVNKELFFSAFDAYTELYKFDGASLAKLTSSNVSGLYNFRKVGRNLFFNGTNMIVGNGDELWMSNGTMGGTFEVKDIYPGISSSNIFPLGSTKKEYIFCADDGSGAGSEVWKSDGTASGTFMITDIYPGAGSSCVTGY